ncbi:MAG: Nif3-like dinuclear metal center hexameric protein [Acidobacteriota bacterium]
MTDADPPLLPADVDPRRFGQPGDQHYAGFAERARAGRGAPGAIDRDALTQHLDRLLDAQRGRDYGPNGLQVASAARREVRRVVVGVSACVALFERAAALDADAVLAHHGIFWKGDDPRLVGSHGKRVRALIEHDLNLYAYHLPLDRHPALGNNALGAQLLGLVDVAPFDVGSSDLPIGVGGRFDPPIPADALIERCVDAFGRAPDPLFLHGPDPIARLALVTGGAQRDVHAAIAQGFDAFITGEVSEWVMHLTAEAGIHYAAAGHHATERHGVRALGVHLADRFGLDVHYVDLPNPV